MTHGSDHPTVFLTKINALMRKLITLLFIFCYILSPPGPVYGQEAMEAAEQQSVVDSLIETLANHYVFPDVAQKMGDHLRKQFKAGVFGGLTNPVSFADRLTEELQFISKDRHLRVNFNPDGAQMMRAHQDEEGPGEPDEEFLNSLKRENFGFREIKILEGNVGYLDLRGFMPAALAGETAAAAMNLLSNTDAIIFDLRQNGGGDPGMIQLLTSYLYEGHDHIHLNNFYFRPTNDTTQTWTLPYVPGQRNPDAEVVVLTSGYTFSAAEEFTYNLKNLERATIVGETTGGGAHPGGTRPIDQRFVAFVPNGRAINPITHTNWEGTGVSTHLAVDPEKALAVGHLTAIEKLGEKAKTEEDKRYYQWYATYLKAKAEPVVLTEEQLEACTGQFGPRNLLQKDGRLLYQRSGRPEMELVILNPTTFVLKEDPNIRFSVEIDQGKAHALILENVDGWREKTERTDAQP